MDEFPSFCEYCKPLGHFKKECVSLHPHLAKESPINLKSVNAAGKETYRLAPFNSRGFTISSTLVPAVIDLEVSLVDRGEDIVVDARDNNNVRENIFIPFGWS
ncbi:hypothetical protein MA16_Dca008178 [Dendrobium catenatum]|uniref:CCHC-type domain-containing protein n=1 Tax=Dendrobium catenatum TaxID=906689 RepID=A0A2I0XA17_9ASPA|nr:hypothetical protein MA16_Dca008178 [Dendrobium catenatum]